MASKKIAEELNQESIPTTAINLRFIKPVDTTGLAPLIKSSTIVCVMEDGSQLGGGFHYLLNQFNHINKPLNEWMSIAIPDEFIDHGKVDELQNDIGLSTPQIKSKITAALANFKATIKFQLNLL